MLMTSQLELPATAVDGGVSTGNVADLVIAFKDTPLKALNPTAFATLFAGVTLRPTVDVEIQGKADVIVRTPIGDIAISNIAFDVHSQLTGTMILTIFWATFSFFFRYRLLWRSRGSQRSRCDRKRQWRAIHHNVTEDDTTEPVPDFPGHCRCLATSLLQRCGDWTCCHSCKFFLQLQEEGLLIHCQEFNLHPGANDFNTEFHYQPAVANDTVAQVGYYLL